MLFSDITLQTPVKKLHISTEFADMGAKCKEEQDHIPIIKINSVRSMASPHPAPETQVISTNSIIQTTKL